MDAQQQRALPQGHQATASTTTTKARRVKNTGPDSAFIATIRDNIRMTPGTYESVLQLLVNMESEIFASARSTSTASSTTVPEAGSANTGASSDEQQALLPPLSTRYKPGAPLGSYKDEYAPGRFQAIWGYTNLVPGDLVPDPTVSGGSYYSVVDDGEGEGGGGGVRTKQHAEHEGEHQRQNRDQVQVQVQEYKHEYKHEHEHEYKHEHEHEHEQQMPANPHRAQAATVKPAVQPDSHMSDVQRPAQRPAPPTTTPTPFTRTLGFAAQAIRDHRYPNDDSDDAIHGCSPSSGVFFPSETCVGYPEFERRVEAGMHMGAAQSRHACYEELEVCLTRAVDCLVAGKVLESAQGWE